MRILFDLQACQSGSRFRGIGRYSMSLVREMARRLVSKKYDVVVFLNGNFPDEFDQVFRELKEMEPGLRFVLFRVPAPCAAGAPENGWRQRAAELLREHAIACIEPDFVHVSTLLADGWGDDAIASVGELGISVPTALTHYDLIPLVMAEIYMSDDSFRKHYLRKLEGVKRADLLLAISEYSRREVIERLGRDEDSVVNISSAINGDFEEHSRHLSDIDGMMARYGLRPGFLLYAPGGFDARKNLNRLIEAYASLPASLRAQHQLVITSQLCNGQREAYLWKASGCGLTAGEVVLTDYVLDHDLVGMYRACHAYVFPSLYEGFGLPVLEAMSCGAAVIASDITSIPEVVGLREALFDPQSVESIAEKLRLVLTDTDFLSRLKAHAKIQPSKFSWARSAEIAVAAIEGKHDELIRRGHVPIARSELPSCDVLLAILAEADCGVESTDDDIQQFRECYAANYISVSL